MNKDNFLMRLEQLLYEIPREEREEAMDYYRSYFEDAGPENEAAVIEELESPQSIADSIKEALNSTGNMTGALKNPPQLREGQTQSKSGNSGQNGQPENGGWQTRFTGADFQKTSQDESGSSYQNTSGQASYSRYDQYNAGRGRHAFSGMDKKTKLILIIIAAVFLLPVWGSLASAALGIIGAMIGIVAALGIFSVGGVIGGFVCTVAAIVSLCTMAITRGLLLLGTGMLLIAAGGLSIVLLLLICTRLLPWAVRQIVRLFHWVIQWGRSAA